MRAGIVAALAIAAAGVGVSLIGGSSDPADEEPTPVVAFEATISGEGDSKPSDEAVQAEGEKIVELLDDWYQQAFVDPEKFGDGTFPEVAATFDEAARIAFAEDVDALTIGPAREEVERVEPTTATATITVFFEKGKTPTWATAAVSFAATATLKDETAPPVGIDQTVTLFLRRTDEGWLVSTYYDAHQEQRSIETSPSPSGSPA